MRVYELARETGVSSAEVLQAAESAGIDAASAISTLTGGDADKLREALKGADRAALAAKREAKRAKSAAARQAKA